MSWPNCTEGCEKTWPGDDPKCGFGADGVFKPNFDWNCGLVGRIRRIIHEAYE